MHSLPRHPSHYAEPSGVPTRRPRWLALASVLAAAALAAVCAWGGDGWSAVPLPDVGQPANLALTGGDRLMGGPSGVSALIAGEIDGEVEVWADGWGPQRLRGRADWRVYHDWFDPSCTLHYRPVGEAVSGRLVVRYRFH